MRELDSGAKILALRGIINYILADREMRQWVRFQLPVMGLALLLVLMMVLGELSCWRYHRSFDEVRR